MKRIGGLFDQTLDRATFSIAAGLAAQGKRNRRAVQNFFADFDQNTIAIIEKLRTGDYFFGQYCHFFVRDPKTRRIHAPPFSDRVVHHAIIFVAGNTFERGAYSHSYACRAGKGQHAALRQAKLWSRSNDWFLKLDIEKFYDSVDHEHLSLLLRRRFSEEPLLHLLNRLLESYAFSPGKGLPIGALTSQYLGNFYLDTVDRWAKQTMRCRRFVRYMDDMVFWGSQSDMRKILHDIRAFLVTMGLRIKQNGQLNRCELGLPFLGFVVYPNRFRLNAQGKKRLRSKIRSLERSFVSGDCDEEELQKRGEALFAHAKFADDANWRRELEKFTLWRES